MFSSLLNCWLTHLWWNFSGKGLEWAKGPLNIKTKDKKSIYIYGSNMERDLFRIISNMHILLHFVLKLKFDLLWMYRNKMPCLWVYDLILLFIFCLSQLCRPSSYVLLRRCKYLIRKCQFQELAANDSTGAMIYLQNDLAAVIDHENEEEKKEVPGLWCPVYLTFSDTWLLI